MSLGRRLAFAAASLLFTYLFFFEYLRPFRWVHIPYDLNVYHYSLADYAFRALRSGRFPFWDPTQFCGIGFASNIQAELFYPPTWLMFLVDWRRNHLAYSTLEVFLIAHVWLAFVLCYRWLRARDLSPVAGLLASGVYAFSGYMCMNLQHLGLVVAYAWFPLGFEGIDGAVRTRNWKPLLKLVLASAMAILAGYPPTFFVFAVYAGVYAFCSFDWKVVAGAFVAFVASLGVAAAQLLPTIEATGAKIPELKYGLGMVDPWYHLSYFVPNFYNFSLNAPLQSNPGMDYLFLGSPALLGLALLWRYRKPKNLVPFIGAGLAGIVLLTNPFNMIWATIQHSQLLSDLCRSGYFLAAPVMMITPLAAYGLDDFLRRKVRATPKWFGFAMVVVAIGYSIWQVTRWAKDRLPFGPRSIVDLGISIAVLAATMFALRPQSGKLRTTLAAAVLLIAAADYKAFGTSKRFDAGRGPGMMDFVSSPFPGMGIVTFMEIRGHPEYRVLVASPGGPLALELRHVEFNAVQGFDPLFTSAYRDTLQDVAHFTERDQFTIDPRDSTALERYGVRYFITNEAGDFYKELLADPRFRLIKEESFYQVFEYINAKPSFGWEAGAGAARIREWRPESRIFDVQSDSGGRFTLTEQFLPGGWRASVDGQPIPVERWATAFQAIPVPAGIHRIEFRYAPRSIVYGGWISAFSIALIVLLNLRTRVPRARRSFSAEESASR
jgi:hypothetical protein